MDYDKLAEKRDLLNENMNLFSKELLNNYQNDFDINFTHESAAIEGNTLTLMETKLLLEDKISVSGKDLREIYEVVNHNKAWKFAENNIKNCLDLDENLIKTFHKILMENIMDGGVYRDADVKITGAKHSPPSRFILSYELKDFYNTLSSNNFNGIELVAYTHGEFVKIHPFFDGNGRLSRILMNYQLVKNKFLPITIKNYEKLNYYDVLDEYAVNNNLKPFVQLLYELEEEQLDFYLKQIKSKIK
ncbi:MAG: Fic family protein [Methanobrevibacter sp.]|nr:Fic family protein [Candidatus Methanovirga procula]